MRQFSTVWLGIWLSAAPAALLIPQPALATPEAVAGSPADVAPSVGVGTSAPQPSAITPDDVPIAEGLRMLLGDSLDSIVDRARDRDALRTFYQERNHAPLWVRSSGPSEQFRAAVTRLNNADGDGLNAADYPTPDLQGAGGPETLARAELTLMASLLTYARHAQSGRVDPSRISPNVSVTPPVPEPLHVLRTLAGADDVPGALDAFNPPHRGFQALRARLQELRQSGAIASQPAPRRAGNRTANPIDSILSNMERWRWLPRDLGPAYVLVNIPDYTLDVVRDERSVFHTRIVVGKKDTPSPIFSDEIESVQVNPTWHVPDSIVYGKYLPALSSDPDVLRRMGLIVSRSRDGTVSVRQPPGPRNALGRLKVNFPNPFHVYLHDTPDKHLFTREQRAYSSGCMRVQNPDQFAAHVLSLGAAEGGYTPTRLAAMYGTAERTIALTTRIPVHLVYMNAYVADDGKLVVKPDIYGYDARVQSALKGRYMVVNERSQRFSSVTRSARVSRSVAHRAGPRRVAQDSAYGGWQQQRNVFGGTWGWNPGY